jgi:hypothetical protein
MTGGLSLSKPDGSWLEFPPGSDPDHQDETLMARANSNHTTLSSLIRDPFVRAAFEAAERDGLAPLAVEVDNPPSLDGGAVVKIELEGCEA